MKHVTLCASFIGAGIIVASCVAPGTGADRSAIHGDDLARGDLADDTRDETACIPGKVWTADSARIGLSWASYWFGYFRYEKAREDLTPEQSAALERLCLRGAPRRGLVADATRYGITITDRSGARHDYRAVIDDFRDIDEGPLGDKPTIAYKSLKPFLDTIHCLSARNTRPRGTEAPPAEPPWSDAPAMSADPGCFNDVFVPETCKDLWLKLQIDARGEHEIRAAECIGTVTLHILSEDGVELASSRPGAAPSCPEVSYAFEQEGTYLVKIEKKNGSTCDEQGPAGRISIRIRRAR